MSAAPPAAQFGDFVVQRMIGQGSFGKVMLAKNQRTEETRALKLIDKQGISDIEDVQRVYRETFILTSLRHTNIIRLFDVLEAEGALVLVMEYADGGELKDYVEAKGGRLDEQEACKLFREIVSGVDYCHRKRVIHRDLKLENILLDRQSGHVKIADFGLSDSIRFGEKMGTNCGTPVYAPPEILDGSDSAYAGPPADIWSLGIILFAMTCGYLPFEAASEVELFRKIRERQLVFPEYVSSEVRDLIDKMLVVDPQKRFTLSDIRAHSWFEMVYDQELRARIAAMPEVTSAMVQAAHAYSLKATDPSVAKRVVPAEEIVREYMAPADAAEAASPAAVRELRRASLPGDELPAHMRPRTRKGKRGSQESVESGASNEDRSPASHQRVLSAQDSASPSQVPHLPDVSSSASGGARNLRARVRRGDVNVSPGGNRFGKLAHLRTQSEDVGSPTARLRPARSKRALSVATNGLPGYSMSLSGADHSSPTHHAPRSSGLPELRTSPNSVPSYARPRTPQPTSKSLAGGARSPPKRSLTRRMGSRHRKGAASLSPSPRGSFHRSLNSNSGSSLSRSPSPSPGPSPLLRSSTNHLAPLSASDGDQHSPSPSSSPRVSTLLAMANRSAKNLTGSSAGSPTGALPPLSPSAMAAASGPASCPAASSNFGGSKSAAGRRLARSQTQSNALTGKKKLPRFAQPRRRSKKTSRGTSSTFHFDPSASPNSGSSKRADKSNS